MADTTPDWKELDADDVYRRMSADEIYQLANVQLAPGEFIVTSQGQYLVTSSGEKFQLTPPTITIVEDVVTETAREIRGAIMAGGYVVDDDPKIPLILEGYALDIVPFKLWSRLGGKMVDIDGSRETLFNRAVEVIKKIESGRYDAIPKTAGVDDTPQSESALVASSTKLRL